MLPDGYYHGHGPWWLRGWKGKFFNSDWMYGWNVFRGGEVKLRFDFHQKDERIYIVYRYPYQFVRDVMVPYGADWRGKIYVCGVKVGTFELRK